MLGREEKKVNKIRGGILADEVGLGKTVQMLATIHANTDVLLTLIVVPLSVVDQWYAECISFTGITPLVVTSTQIARKNLSWAEVTRHRVVIASHSCFTSHSIDYTDHILLRVPFDRVVIDEAHVIKNKSSKIFKRTMQIRAPIRWCLTGTPVVSNIKDMQSLIAFLMGSIKYVRAAGMHARDKEIRMDIFKRRTKQDVQGQQVPLDLQLKMIPFAPDERRAYARRYRAGRIFTSRLEGSLPPTMRDFTYILNVISKLRQLCVCNSKMNALVESFSGHLPGTRSLVFCNWRREIVHAQKALTTNKSADLVMEFHGSMNAQERAAVIDTFMDTSRTESMALLIQIEAGGVGLNLQQASQVYILSPHWNATSEQQAIGRAHRGNTPHPVTVTRFVLQDTIEEFIHRVQERKLGTAADVLDDDRLKKSLTASDDSEVSWTMAQQMFENDVFDDQMEDDESPRQPNEEMVEISVAVAGSRDLEYLHSAIKSVEEFEFRVDIKLTPEGGNAIRESLGLMTKTVWTDSVYQDSFEKYAAELGFSAQYEAITYDDDTSGVQIIFTLETM